MYDERESLGPTADKALTVLAGISADFELLIVDDGSRDGSERVADELAARDPRVRVVRHERNLGYGQALRSGFAAARGRIVAYTDCDQPADLALLPQALERLADPAVDMLIGYRTSRGACGPRRRFYSAAYNMLVRALFGVRVRDVNFAFKLIRKSAVERLRLTARTGFIDGQLLVEARRLKLRLVEMPVEYRLRQFGRSHFDSLATALATLAELLRYWAGLGR
jgi:glycosyltransferase involved in cell wall biosynthesis